MTYPENPPNQRHQDNCLMCAVRALTEGVPRIWWPKDPGEVVTGVVLKMGEADDAFGKVPYVDLWLGGQDRVRIQMYGSVLQNAVNTQAPQVGDMLSVWFDGERTINKHNRKDLIGRTYKAFSANVQRGH